MRGRVDEFNRLLSSALEVLPRLEANRVRLGARWTASSSYVSPGAPHAGSMRTATLPHRVDKLNSRILPDL